MFCTWPTSWKVVFRNNRLLCNVYFRMYRPVVDVKTIKPKKKSKKKKKRGRDKDEIVLLGGNGMKFHAADNLMKYNLKPIRYTGLAVEAEYQVTMNSSRFSSVFSYTLVSLLSPSLLSSLTRLYLARLFSYAIFCLLLYSPLFASLLSSPRWSVSTRRLWWRRWRISKAWQVRLEHNIRILTIFSSNIDRTNFSAHIHWIYMTTSANNHHICVWDNCVRG